MRKRIPRVGRRSSLLERVTLLGGGSGARSREGQRPVLSPPIYTSVLMLEGRSRSARKCKKVQWSSDQLTLGTAFRMSFYDLLIGSSMDRILPAIETIALDREKCNGNYPSCSLCRREAKLREDNTTGT